MPSIRVRAASSPPRRARDPRPAVAAPHRSADARPDHEARPAPQAARRADRSPLPQSPLPTVRRARAGFTSPGADPHERLLARLRKHVLADLLAGRSLDEVDERLDGVAGLGEEEQAALWLYGWVSADR